MITHVADVVLYACENNDAFSSSSSNLTKNFTQEVQNMCGGAAVTRSAILHHLNFTLSLSPSSPVSGGGSAGAVFEADFTQMMGEVVECTASAEACVIDGWCRWLQPS
jgi:hypothetical protein